MHETCMEQNTSTLASWRCSVNLFTPWKILWMPPANKWCVEIEVYSEVLFMNAGNCSWLSMTLGLSCSFQSRHMGFLSRWGWSAERPRDDLEIGIVRDLFSTAWCAAIIPKNEKCTLQTREGSVLILLWLIKMMIKCLASLLLALIPWACQKQQILFILNNWSVNMLYCQRLFHSLVQKLFRHMWSGIGCLGAENVRGLANTAVSE